MATGRAQRCGHHVGTFDRIPSDAEQALRAFAVTTWDEVDVTPLEEELSTLIQQTIQPTHVSVWTRERQR